MKKEDVMLKEVLKEKYSLKEEYVELLIKICKNNDVRKPKEVIEEYLKEKIK